MTEKQQQEIFDEWLRQHKGIIYKLLKAFAKTTESQDDLFQEICIQLWRSVPSFLQRSAVSTWVYRIALNTAIKWDSTEKKHTQTENLDSTHHILFDAKAIVDERLSWLYEEISKLDKIDRSIALLMLDSFSYREMALILGISESNIGVRINRIKKELIQQSKKIDYHEF